MSIVTESGPQATYTREQLRNIVVRQIWGNSLDPIYPKLTIGQYEYDLITPLDRTSLHENFYTNSPYKGDDYTPQPFTVRRCSPQAKPSWINRFFFNKFNKAEKQKRKLEKVLNQILKEESYSTSSLSNPMQTLIEDCIEREKPTLFDTTELTLPYPAPSTKIEFEDSYSSQATDSDYDSDNRSEISSVTLNSESPARSLSTASIRNRLKQESDTDSAIDVHVPRKNRANKYQDFILESVQLPTSSINLTTSSFKDRCPVTYRPLTPENTLCIEYQGTRTLLSRTAVRTLIVDSEAALEHQSLSNTLKGGVLCQVTSDNYDKQPATTRVKRFMQSLLNW
ncbi:hypothetical protein SOPP22_03515 [Shewanella sp. OPT22]|nr:hypothetical protein SOPP22_03515 [Shewanella sp. OPT22]